MIQIYTDGSSNNKEKIAGWATVIYLPNNKKPMAWYGHLPPPSTNNQGELLGYLSALGMIKTLESMGKCSHFEILCDSQYTLGILNNDMNWSATKNHDFISLGFRLMNSIRSNIVNTKVKGHSGIEGNELADKFAKHGRFKEKINDPRFNSVYFDTKEAIFTKLEKLLNPEV